MSLMIESLDDATPAWLGDVLHVKVANISSTANDAFNSSIAHLNVKYSEPVDLPSRLILKLNNDHAGQYEIQFYRFAENIDLSMMPRRLGMEYDSSTGFSFLLLEDISDSHMTPIRRDQLLALNGVPDMEQLEMIVDAVAGFHAAFWEQPSLGSVSDTTEMRSWYRDDDFHAKHVERRRNEWAKFLELYRDELPKEWITLGESILESLPKLFESRIKPRLSPRRALTMSQGDCYLTQFLVPREGFGQAYLIDFQDACVNFPTFDLVFMFATFWTHEQRAGIEQKLLHRYLDTLTTHGIDYDWDLLCDDYRLCLSYMFFDAVWNATSGSRREYWKPKLSCLIAAYQDWKCGDLIHD